jgi:hypothetical protein
MTGNGGRLSASLPTVRTDHRRRRPGRDLRVVDCWCSGLMGAGVLHDDDGGELGLAGACARIEQRSRRGLFFTRHAGSPSPICQRRITVRNQRPVASDMRRVTTKKRRRELRAVSDRTVKKSHVMRSTWAARR